MDEHDSLAGRFEDSRTHLRRVAYRMLGSMAEADDAVQEAWIRLSRTDTSGVENLRGWLTTVVGRVCLDMLRSRRSRREAPLDEQVPETIARASGPGPEQEALLADAVGPALLVVLESLAPAERLAFVLHDMFAVPFDEIAQIVGRSEEATRQLASRGRRRVKGGSPEVDASRERRRAVVAAFLAASRDGDFQALLAVLDPDVVCRADAAAVASGAAALLRGAPAVADSFKGRAKAARLVLVDGAPGLAWIAGGQARVVFSFTIAQGRIASIDLLADPARLAALDLEVLDE
jgi:RNA polymerase sigma factor (sigma-70 family)